MEKRYGPSGILIGLVIGMWSNLRAVLVDLLAAQPTRVRPPRVEKNDGRRRIWFEPSSVHRGRQYRARHRFGIIDIQLGAAGRRSKMLDDAVPGWCASRLQTSRQRELTTNGTGLPRLSVRHSFGPQERRCFDV